MPRSAIRHPDTMPLRWAQGFRLALKYRDREMEVVLEEGAPAHIKTSYVKANAYRTAMIKWHEWDLGLATAARNKLIAFRLEKGLSLWRLKVRIKHPIMDTGALAEFFAKNPPKNIK